jgi:predicted house-cleaning noncanonical NTP pyrophosphatase (MazG superfamily)
MRFTHTNCRIEREYPKLVRDRIPEIILKNDGRKAPMRILRRDKEFLGYLLKKLVEEAVELQKSTARGNLEEELADVFEIIDAILKVEKKTRGDIVKIQRHKRKARGGFKRRILMLRRSTRGILTMPVSNSKLKRVPE